MTRSSRNGTLLLCLALLLTRSVASLEVEVGPDDRTTTLYVPGIYDPAVPMPLVLNLHGFGGNGTQQEGYTRFLPLSERLGFLYVHPDGTENPAGSRFWRATDTCCGPADSTVDDSTYLRDLIEEISTRYSVDPDRIYVVGHSNGGFMAYRIACDHADTIAAIASLAGATYQDVSLCDPETPVHVLQIHGDADSVVLYESVPGFRPGAVASVEQWAVFNGCEVEGVDAEERLDLVSTLPGPETRITRYDTGCGLAVSELWTIEGGTHIPGWNSRDASTSFATAVTEWFFDHPKERDAPECPLRIRGKRSEVDQVRLTWINGEVIPAGVDIVRDGEVVAAGIPAEPPEFVDSPPSRGPHSYVLSFDVPGSDCRQRTVLVDNTPECDTHCRAATAELIQTGDANVRVTIDAHDDTGDTILYTLRGRARFGAWDFELEPQASPLFDLELAPGRWTLEARVEDDLVCSPTASDIRCSTVVTVPDLPLAPQFVRGDCTGDGRVDIADPVCTLNWLFSSAAALPCVAATNANGDETIDITDPVSVLTFLFSDGRPPVEPYPDCGPGALPADETLGCDSGPESCQVTP